MIRMKAEAVVITKPDKNTGLNGANINMNGKVLLADAADKGYKGAGMLSGEVVLCVASGDRETKAAIQERRQEGCLAVEMECASMLAVVLTEVLREME